MDLFIFKGDSSLYIIFAINYKKALAEVYRLELEIDVQYAVNNN